MDSFGSIDIRKVADLLHPPQEGSDSDNEDQICPTNSTPANIGPPKKLQLKKEKPKLVEDIWKEEEVPTGDVYLSESSDPRTQPEYEIIFKQKVTSEDIFLQLGNKTPMTSSCEDMVLTVKLPATSFAEIHLDVKCQFVDVRSPKFRLCLPLPHPVKENCGKAAWDSEKEILTVTMTMDREFDFVNF